MKLQVRYFASLREALGAGEESRSPRPAKAARLPTSPRCAGCWWRAAAAMRRRWPRAAPCAARSTG